ncbi:hypothetical protein AB0D54_15010 [Streptomyces xanthophaeus]|uniref:hypothetical protein n=1 Tax=Streptomyces xanthophaeus TaxID=67385 RepID=UPI0034273F32
MSRGPASVNPRRRAWGELAMGPFVSPRPAYEDALAHAVHHAEDPFTALPPPKQ